MNENKSVNDNKLISSSNDFNFSGQFHPRKPIKGKVVSVAFIKLF